MKNNTSWEEVSKWYDSVVGLTGHYFHEHVIFPKILPLLKNANSILDIACGQGILSRKLPPSCEYHGVDASSSLIESAKNYAQNKKHHFITGDATLPLHLDKKDFDCVTVILAIQNIENPLAVFKNAFHHLKKGGNLLIVLNHPCFRIPRQTSWQIDENQKLLYRRINLYLSALKIPIKTSPGKENSSETFSFHHPLFTYFKWLKEANFLIEDLQEWTSDKISTGKCAKMENRAREEFPLFLSIIARKN
ncbi:MAG: class I SAM-dependent methyltransferase [Chlamydiae bacterium]|nr:class I SAM-dependent methyltransferase [Chlamydiota bacterium]